MEKPNSYDECLESPDIIAHAKTAYKIYGIGIPYEDTKSVIYYAIWRAFEKYNGKSSFLTYVYNRVKFACLDYKRKAKVTWSKDQIIKDRAILTYDPPKYFQKIDILDSVKDNQDRDIIEKLYILNYNLEDVAKENNLSNLEMAKKVKKIINKIRCEYIRLGYRINK